MEFLYGYNVHQIREKKTKNDQSSSLEPRPLIIVVVNSSIFFLISLWCIVCYSFQGSPSCICIGILLQRDTNSKLNVNLYGCLLRDWYLHWYPWWGLQSNLFSLFCNINIPNFCILLLWKEYLLLNNV